MPIASFGSSELSCLLMRFLLPPWQALHEPLKARNLYQSHPCHPCLPYIPQTVCIALIAPARLQLAGRLRLAHTLQYFYRIGMQSFYVHLSRFDIHATALV